MPAVVGGEVALELAGGGAGELAAADRAEAGRVAAGALVRADGVARAVRRAAVVVVPAREADRAQPLLGGAAAAVVALAAAAARRLAVLVAAGLVGRRVARGVGQVPVNALRGKSNNKIVNASRHERSIDRELKKAAIYLVDGRREQVVALHAGEEAVVAPVDADEHVFLLLLVFFAFVAVHPLPRPAAAAVLALVTAGAAAAAAPATPRTTSTARAAASVAWAAAAARSTPTVIRAAVADPTTTILLLGVQVRSRRARRASPPA